MTNAVHRIGLLSLLFALTGFLQLPTLAYSQQSTRALEDKYKGNSNSPFIVKKGSLDFDDSKDRVIGGFNTFEEAQAASDELNQALKGDDQYRWVYLPLPSRKDPITLDEPLSGPKNVGAITKVKPPDLKIVDPGPSANSKTGDLVGKVFKGKVGSIDVYFAFLSDNVVRFGAGEKKLDATWSIDNEGRLIITAPNATFTGTREGNKVVGKRVSNTGYVSDFTIWLGDPRKAAPPEGKAYNPPKLESKKSPEPPPEVKQATLQGVWATDRNGFVLRIEPGGKLFILNPSSGGSLSAGSWSGDASGFSGGTQRRYDGGGEWSTTYGIVYDIESKVVGNKLVGRFRTNYLKEQGKEIGIWTDLTFLKQPDDAYSSWWAAPGR